MRLVTRTDLDGLTCAVIIGLHEQIDEILLTHSQEMADGLVEIGEHDIIANLPFRAGCALWFDHHMHTTAMAPSEPYRGSFGRAPSAARLVYDYYGGRDKMPQLETLVAETDRLDSADLTLDDILDPQGYIKLGFTLDDRSGLGDLEDYFKLLSRLLQGTIPIEQVLLHPEVERRCVQLEEKDVELHTALKEHSRVVGNVVITDFRALERVPVGNRFLVFALFPDVNIAVRVQWSGERKVAMLTLGHSIVNRTCQTDVGALAARYGGGGHRGAGSIPLVDDPDPQIQMIIAELKANG